MFTHDRTVHLILNPAAGQRRAGRQLRKIMQNLHNDGAEVHEHVTARPMHAAELAKALPDDGAPLCVAGGDGTLNEVMNGLHPGSHPVGVLPFGTGNDFAHMLGIRTMSDTLHALREDRQGPVDIAEVHVVEEDGGVVTRKMINAVGIGFDAAVALDVSNGRGGRGILPYLFSVFRVLRHYQAVPSVTVLQNRELTSSLFLACIGNGRSSGGGFRLTPSARIDDGMLDLCHVRAVSTRRVLQVLPRALNGTHLSAPEISYEQMTHADISLDYPLPVHVDGEVISTQARRIVVSCQPSSHRFFIGG
ncbi:diacylglycerol kinase family lipid kinase [bacterium]|nr:diacylglycerol kinase family lipid kinase [bacterium]